MRDNLSRAKNTLFSIITINYNNKRGLESTVESVISQSYKNFEYIIIDGDSKDGSKEFLNNLILSEIKIVSEKDNGIYDAMNKGISIARGDYLIFMNSGDCFANSDVLDILQLQILNTEEHPKFIYGDSYEKEIDNDILIYKKSKNHSRKKLGMFTHHQSMVFSNDVIVKNKILYDEKYRLAADWDFVLKFLEKISPDQILKIEKSIAIFEAGGFSSNYVLGIKEQYVIRRELLGWNKFHCFTIAFYQYIANNIRRSTPFIYKLYVKWSS